MSSSDIFNAIFWLQQKYVAKSKFMAWGFILQVLSEEHTLWPILGEAFVCKNCTENTRIEGIRNDAEVQSSKDEDHMALQ